MKTKDYQYHLDAGLTQVGYDKNGFLLWLGTNRQWENYEKIAGQDPAELTAEEELSLEAQQEEVMN